MKYIVCPNCKKRVGACRIFTNLLKNGKWTKVKRYCNHCKHEWKYEKV